MKTIWLLAVIATALVMNGQEAKPHSDAHKGKPAAEGTDTSDTGQTFIVVNQQAPRGQENDHPSNPPNSVHELFLIPNILTLALVIVGAAGIVIAIVSLRQINKQIAEMR
ncbi:MAG: hypothetical protein WCB11_05655, partial [Terriglobales bacterium]